MRFVEILDNFLVDAPPGSTERAPQVLGDLAPPDTAMSFASLLEEGAAFDCTRIYTAAAIPSEVPLTVEKALQLISRLPEEIPIANRRVVVKMTLEAMGATAYGVLTDAARKIRAIDGYVQAACDGAIAAAANIDAQIQGLQQQIEELTEKRARFDAQRTGMESTAQPAVDGIRTVVEFFAAPKAATTAATPAPPPAVEPEPVSVLHTVIQVDAPAATAPSVGERPPAVAYDPIRHPGAESDEMELQDPHGGEEAVSGFWEASTTHKSPNSPQEAANTFYTPDGENKIRKDVAA